MPEVACHIAFHSACMFFVLLHDTSSLLHCTITCNATLAALPQHLARLPALPFCCHLDMQAQQITNPCSLRSSRFFLCCPPLCYLLAPQTRGCLLPWVHLPLGSLHAGYLIRGVFSEGHHAAGMPRGWRRWLASWATPQSSPPPLMATRFSNCWDPLLTEQRTTSSSIPSSLQLVCSDCWS